MFDVRLVNVLVRDVPHLHFELVHYNCRIGLRTKFMLFLSVDIYMSLHSWEFVCHI